MTQGRIYNEAAAISAESVKKFYENRAKNQKGWNAVLLKDKRQSAADVNSRNAHEIALLAPHLPTPARVLDVGCGNGRWLANLLQMNAIAHYDGIDFCAPFVADLKAQYAADSRLHFYEMSATALQKEKLLKEYDLIVTACLSMYLNDDDMAQVYKNLGALLSKNGVFYMEESVSTMGQRLTLADFYSEELKTNYNAIYRTPEEYAALLKNEVGGELVAGSGTMLLTAETGAWEETNQAFWLLKR